MISLSQCCLSSLRFAIIHSCISLLKSTAYRPGFLLLFERAAARPWLFYLSVTFAGLVGIIVLLLDLILQKLNSKPDDRLHIWLCDAVIKKNLVTASYPGNKTRANHHASTYVFHQTLRIMAKHLLFVLAYQRHSFRPFFFLLLQLYKPKPHCQVLLQSRGFLVACFFVIVLTWTLTFNWGL